MTNLVYICIRDYSEMAALCVRSLRGRGKFTGPIAIYAPRMDRHLESINEMADVFITEFVHHARLDRITALRAANYRYEYDNQGYILQLDADILAMNDINPLFPIYDTDPGVILYQEEIWQRYRDLKPGHPQDMYLSCMSARKIVAHLESHPINVGHFVISRRLVDKFYPRWWQLALPRSSGAIDVHGADQAAFNALVRSGDFHECAWPVGDVMNASMTPEAEWSKSRLLHFAGYGRRLEKMRELSK